MNFIFFYNGFRLGTGAAVRIGRPAGDAVQRIAQHITQNDTQYLRRITGQGKPSRLYAAETLADIVQFYNIRAAV